MEPNRYPYDFKIFVSVMGKTYSEDAEVGNTQTGAQNYPTELILIGNDKRRYFLKSSSEKCSTYCTQLVLNLA